MLATRVPQHYPRRALAVAHRRPPVAVALPPPAMAPSLRDLMAERYGLTTSTIALLFVLVFTAPAALVRVV